MNRKMSKFGIAVVASMMTLSGLVITGASATTALPTYKIGYQGPLTGGNAQLGLNMKFAVQLAVKNWNATAGRKFNLALVTGDDQGDPNTAPSVATQLSSDPKLIAIVGPAFSGATAASMPIYGPANIAMVTPSATRVSLTIGSPSTNAQNNNAFFRVVANDGVQGPADAKYAVNKLHKKNLLVIDDASTYGAGLASAFATQARSMSGTTVNTLSLAATAGCAAGNTGDDSEYASISVPQGTNIVFYGGYYCDFAKLTGALRTAGYTGTIMSGDGSLDPQYVKDLSNAQDGNGVLLTCACSTVSGPAGNAFNTAFQRLAHFQAGTYSAEAYDAANTIITAMQGLRTVTRAGVLNAIKHITYRGLTKTIKFDANGDVSGSAIYVSKVVVRTTSNSQSWSINQLGLE